VSALRAAGGSQRYCTGVEVRTRDDGQTRTLEADLVVDASGAHSKSESSDGLRLVSDRFRFSGY
jgi:hypothetical protein